MTDQDALIRSICESPFDDTRRLVFADWLNEHDREDQAEYIRKSIRLAVVDKMQCAPRSHRVNNPNCIRCDEHAKLRNELEQLLKVEWFGFDLDHWTAMSWNVVRNEDLIFNLERGFIDKMAQPYRLQREPPTYPDILTRVDKLPLTYIEYNHWPFGDAIVKTWRWFLRDNSRFYATAMEDALIPEWAFLSIIRFWKKPIINYATDAIQFTDRMEAISALSWGVLNTYRELIGLPLLEMQDARN